MPIDVIGGDAAGARIAEPAAPCANAAASRHVRAETPVELLPDVENGACIENNGGANRRRRRWPNVVRAGAPSARPSVGRRTRNLTPWLMALLLPARSRRRDGVKKEARIADNADARRGAIGGGVVISAAPAWWHGQNASPMAAPTRYPMAKINRQPSAAGQNDAAPAAPASWPGANISAV